MVCSSAEKLGGGMGRVMRVRVSGSGSWKRATVVRVTVLVVVMLDAEVKVRKLVADVERYLNAGFLLSKETLGRAVLVVNLRKQSIV